MSPKLQQFKQNILMGIFTYVSQPSIAVKLLDEESIMFRLELEQDTSTHGFLTSTLLIVFEFMQLEL